MIRYTLKLQSDAEPGTGIGGELVNSYVTRDHTGQPVINSSHVKGLLRQNLNNILEPLLGTNSAVDELLGTPGWRGVIPEGGSNDGSAGSESLYHFSNCSLSTGQASHEDFSHVRFVTRTAIDDQTRTIQDGSLRTTEAIAVETMFKGQIYGDATPAADMMLRLGLLSLGAVGANRTRGVGLCAIEIEDENRKPSQLLRELLRLLKEDNPICHSSKHDKLPIPGHDTKQAVVWFKVTFQAESPVLCPETPEASNVLRSGFSIPASTVQGALLHRLNHVDSGLATRCFESSEFRAWPLQPVSVDSCTTQASQLPVRVSLTHKVAKVILDPSLADNYVDEALDDPGLIWDRIDNSPLKASDGTLVPTNSNAIQLWRAADMPRVFRGHGVHNDPQTPDGRNLFTIEAMAPLTWCGLLACPAEAAFILERLLTKDSSVCLGKARSVLGLGKLKLTRQAPMNILQQATPDKPLFIVQSPVALPDQQSGSMSVQDEFKAIVHDWAKTWNLGPIDAVWAAASIRFGWNRHGKAGAYDNGRTPATRVILPGAVIRFQQPLDPERQIQAMLAGLGDGRESGYGAILPHPGKATDLYRLPSKNVRLKSVHGDAVERAIELFERPIHLPSPSQISTVLSHLERSTEDARRFLQGLDTRGSHAYAKWRDTISVFRQWMDGPDESVRERAKISFQVLRDLLVSKGGK